MNHPKLNELHKDLSYSEYAAFDGLRASDLKLLKRSPAHWKYRSTSSPTSALEFGSLFHSALQNPTKFFDLLKVEPEFQGYTKDGRLSNRSADAKKQREEWRASLPKEAKVVTKEDAEQISGMLKSCANHSLLKNFLKNGVSETSLWVEDPETGETLQCRPDFITAYGHMADIKTTVDASYPYFLNEIYRSKMPNDRYYALQAAHYSHCAKHSQAYVNGERVRGDAFHFIAIEKEPPYAIMIWSLDEHCIDPAEQFRGSLTRLYSKCKKENNWPAYPEAAVAVCPPDWAELPNEEGRT